MEKSTILEILSLFGSIWEQPKMSLRVWNEVKKINNGWLLILRSVPIGTKNIYYYTIFLFLEHCGKWWHFFCLFCRVWPSHHKTDIWRLLFYTLKIKYLQKLVKFFIPFYCWKKNASRPIVLNHYLHKLLWCLPLCSI